MLGQVEKVGDDALRAMKLALADIDVAEGVGFEPTEACASHAFQACRFGRFRIPPGMKDTVAETSSRAEGR